jgi:hypothetical protein
VTTANVSPTGTGTRITPGSSCALLAALAIGWIPVDEQKRVGMPLVAFVFPLELVATIVASSSDASGPARCERAPVDQGSSSRSISSSQSS